MNGRRPAPALPVAGLSRGSVSCEFATRLVADTGIEVVKIETTAGDPLRDADARLFAYLTAGKRGVATDAAVLAATLRALAGRFAAFVVDEWGRDILAPLSLDVPVVVVGERDGTALQGMRADRADEFLAFHGTGLGFITPRVMPGYPSGDPLCPTAHLVEFLTGLYGAIATFAVLGRRPELPRDGAPGASIGFTAAALPLLRREVAAVLYDGAHPHRSERIWKVSPAEVHRCRDGWVFVDVIEDGQWRKLCDYMGRADLRDDGRYATRDQRFAHADTLCAILDAFFAPLPKACWIDAQAHGVPVAPVNEFADLRRDPQLEARAFWTRIADAAGTPLTAPSSPLARLFGRPGGAAARAPAVGADNADFLEAVPTA